MQRKLNTRFLVILTIVVVAGLMVLVVGGRYLFRGTADKHLKMAELYTRENRLADAAEEYKTAISLDRRNPETFVKLGDVMRLLTRTDPMMVDKDKQYWTMALEVDPSYLPAMQLLLNAYIEDAQLWPQPQMFERLRDICNRILAVDPNDARAKAQLHMSWLQRWMVGVETPSVQTDQSMVELKNIQAKEPANIDVPYILARARIKHARDLFAQDRLPDAASDLAEAESTMQQLIEANPDNSLAHLRQGQVLMEIAGVYAKDLGRRKTYRAMGIAAVTRACELAKPADPLAKPEDPAYAEVNMALAALMAQEQKNDQAEKIYRELLDRRPEDRSVRIALAQMMAADPAKRADAIALLDQGVSDDQAAIGSRVRLRGDQELRAQIVLAGLRIDALAGLKDEQEKKDLQAKIEEHLKTIYNRQGESPEYLRLKGRLCQAQNQYVDAIQTYSRAAAMLAQLGQPQNDDMMYQLARVYIAAQQTGEARNILEDLVRKYDSFLPARILLCRVLLTEGSRDKLAVHLRYLEQTAANDPQVTALLLAASVQQDPKRSRDLLAKLPESTRDEKITKAKAAFEADQVTETQRLADDILKQTPADEEAAQLSVQALLRQSKPGEAQRVLSLALAANADSRVLRLLKAQLEGGGEQLDDAIDEDIDRIPDEFTRELKKSAVADSRGKTEEALAHLANAEKIKPDAPELWDQYFQFYARQKQWDKLQPYLDKLIAVNHDRAGGLLYQFRLAMARNEVDRAIDLARQMTVKLPEFAQSWLALAQGLQSGRKYEEAKQAYLRVLEKQAANLDAYRGLVESCYAMRQTDDAGRHIADARRRMPNNSVLKQMEIEYELNYGQPEKVIGLIEAQASRQKDKPQSWAMLGRAYERILQRKAAKGGDDEVRKWASTLREHYGKAFEKWPDNSEFAGKFADACLQLNLRDEAERALTQHAEKVPDKPEPALMLAEFYARTNQPAQAELVLRKAAERMPKATELWQRIATIQVLANKIDDAIATLDAAPDQDQVLTQKLEILLQARSTARAKELIQGALARKGEDFSLINAQAYVALQENDLKGARALADRSLALKPDNPIALHQRALAKLKDTPADIDGAIIDLKLATQQAPQNVELRVTTSEAYMARRDRDGAIREMEVAAALAPRNRVLWNQLMDLYLGSNPPRVDDCRALIEQVRAAGGNTLELTMRSAVVAQMHKDVPGAIAEMRRAVDMSSGKEEVVRAYMSMMLDLAQYDLLLKESEQLLAQNPDAWWIRHLRASAHAKLGQKEEALSEWELALSLAGKAKDDSGAIVIMRGIAQELGLEQVMPRVLERAKTDTRWVILAAWLYHSANDTKNAIAMIEQAMKKESIDSLSAEEQTRAMAIAGAVYLSAQPPMVDEALKIYNKLLDQDREDLQALNNVACIYIDSKSPPQPAKALEYSQRAYDAMRRRGVNQPMLIDTHGWVLANNKRVAEGIVLLQEVVQNQPFLEARFHLAQALLLGNYPDAALRQANEAKQMISAMEAKSIPVDAAIKAKVELLLAKVASTSTPGEPTTKP